MVLKKFVQLQNIGVVQFFQNTNLRQQFSLLLGLQKFLINYLNRPQGFRVLVQAFANFSVST